MPPVEGLLTAADVAERLNMSRDYVYAHAYEIGRVKLGRSLRFRVEDVERFIRSKAEDTPTEIARIDVRKL